MQPVSSAEKETKGKRLLSYFLCFLAYTIFGFSFLFSKTALNYATPIVLLAVRFWVAFLILNLLLLTRKVSVSLKGKPVWKLLILGVIQPIIYFTCENYGIALTSSAFAGVMIGLVPVAGLICGRVFLKEKGTVFQTVCAFLSVIGVALTTAGGTVTVSLSGTVLLLIAVISTSVFAALSRSLSDVFTSYERTYIMFALGCVFFTCLALFESRNDLAGTVQALLNVKFCISVLYLAAISSVCAFLFINYALNYLSVGTNAVLSNFCTVVSVPAGILIMHDAFSAWQIIGVIVILISVFGVSVPPRSAARK